MKKKAKVIGKGNWDVSRPFMCALDYGRLSKKTGQMYYPLDFIHTEKEFVSFIKNYLIEELKLFDYGFFIVMAHQKGIFGPYIFWRGEIYPDYWVFHENKALKKFDENQIRRYEDEISKTNNIDEVESLKLEISSIKDDAKLEKSFRRYGILPFLTVSSKRGRMNYWNEVGVNIQNLEEQKQEKQDLGIQNFSKKRVNKKLNEMSLDEINSMNNG